MEVQVHMNFLNKFTNLMRFSLKYFKNKKMGINGYYRLKSP